MKNNLKFIYQEGGYILFLLLSGIVVNPSLFMGYMPFDFDNLAFYHPMFSLTQLSPVPLWDPYQFSGFPIFAEPQYAMFYPLRFIFRWMDIFPAMSVFYILHYVMGLIFMYAFLRSLSLSRISSTGGTLCFIHGSYYIGKIMMSATLFFSMVWIPLFFLLSLKALNHKSFRYSISAGWILGIIALIGSPHHIFYPILAMGIYVIFLLFQQYINKSLNKSYTGVLLLCFLIILFIGIGLGCLQFIPAQELLGQSVRAELSYEQITEPSLAGEWILGSFLGGTQIGEFLDASAYFSVSGLLLGIMAFIHFRFRRMELGYWLIIIILSLLIARGRYGLFYPIFYHFPFLKSLSFPCRSLILMAIAGPVLAGYGIESVIQMRSEGIKKYNYAILISLFFLSLFLLIFLYSQYGNKIWLCVIDSKWTDHIIFRWVNLSVYFMVTIVLVLFYWRGMLTQSFFSILLSLILIIELYSFSQRLNNRTVDASEFLTIPKTAQYLQENIQPPARFLGYEASRLYAIDQQDNRFMNYITPRLGELYRLEDAQGYDPMMLKRYVTLMEKLAGRSPVEDPQRMATVKTCNPRFLNMMNVEYIVGEVNEKNLYIQPVVLTNSLSSTLTLSLDTPCTEISFISLLNRNLNIPQGTIIGTVKLEGTIGEQEILPVRAGIETADWRAGEEPSKHNKPTPAMSWVFYQDKNENLVHNYYTRIQFTQPMIPTKITFSYLVDEGYWVVQNLLFTTQNDENQFEKLADFGEMRIYRNRTVFPRAFLVHQSITLKDENKLLAALAEENSNLREIAYLSEKLSSPLDMIENTDIQDSVKIIFYSPHKIVLESESEKNSFLVLSEIFYPGWKAYVDGKSTHIYQTNYTLRGIYLDKGKHNIEFYFKPLSLRIGMVIAIITLLCSIFYFIYGKFSQCYIHT